VRNRTRDGLADPPRAVGAELVTTTVFELVDRLHQTDVTLLDEVQELQATVRVLLRDGNHEAQVGLDELGLGALGFSLATTDRVESPSDLLDVDLVFLDVLRVARVLVHALEALDHAFDDLLAQPHLLQRLNHLRLDAGALLGQLRDALWSRTDLL